MLRVQFKSFQKRVKGNILAITLIVSALASTAAIGVGVIALQDVNVSTQQDDASQAYHAASSTLELGLLAFKHNRNEELSATCQDETDPGCVSVTNNTNILPVRIFLDRLGCSPSEMNSLGTKCFDIPVNATNVYYEAVTTGKRIPTEIRERVGQLKIWYKGTQLGNKDMFLDSSGNFSDSKLDTVLGKTVQEVGTTYPNLKILRKDQPLTLKLETGKNYKVYWHPIYQYGGQDTVWNDDSSQLRNGRNRDEHCTAPARPDLSFACGLYRISSTGMDNDSFPAYDKTLYGGRKTRYFPLPNGGEWRLKPIGTDIIYTVVPDPINSGALMDTGITIIQATGFYGNAQRKLEARINRENGQLLGITDFAVYTKGCLPPSQGDPVCP